MTEQELKKEAEKLFPYPFKACYIIRAKTDWKREKWIQSQVNSLPVKAK